MFSKEYLLSKFVASDIPEDFVLSRYYTSRAAQPPVNTTPELVAAFHEAVQAAPSGVSPAPSARSGARGATARVGGRPRGPVEISTSAGAAAAAAASRVRAEDVQWRYRDLSGAVQGPFSGKQMQEWKAGNLLPADLPVCAEGSDEFQALKSLPDDIFVRGPQALLDRERAERDRLRAERERAERQQQEAEREKLRVELEKLEREKKELERRELERQERERAERDRAERERADRERAELEREEREDHERMEMELAGRMRLQAMSDGDGHRMTEQERAQYQQAMMQRMWHAPPGAQQQMSGPQMNVSQMNGSKMNGSQMNGSQMNGSKMNGSQMNGSQMNGPLPPQMNGPLPLQMNGPLPPQMNGPMPPQMMMTPEMMHMHQHQMMLMYVQYMQRHGHPPPPGGMMGPPMQMMDGVAVASGADAPQTLEEVERQMRGGDDASPSGDAASARAEDDESPEPAVHHLLDGTDDEDDDGHLHDVHVGFFEDPEPARVALPIHLPPARTGWGAPSSSGAVQSLSEIQTIQEIEMEMERQAQERQERAERAAAAERAASGRGPWGTPASGGAAVSIAEIHSEEAEREAERRAAEESVKTVARSTALPRAGAAAWGAAHKPAPSLLEVQMEEERLAAEQAAMAAREPPPPARRGAWDPVPGGARPVSVAEIMNQEAVAPTKRSVKPQFKPAGSMWAAGPITPSLALDDSDPPLGASPAPPVEDDDDEVFWEPTTVSKPKPKPAAAPVTAPAPTRHIAQPVHSEPKSARRTKRNKKKNLIDPSALGFSSRPANYE